METAHHLTPAGDSPGTPLTNRTRFAVIVMALLLSLFASGLTMPRADAASRTMQPFGQHVTCYGGSFATTANIYPGAFSSNGYLAFPTERAYYYAVTPAGSSRILRQGWISSVKPINTAYLSGTSFDFYLWTAWRDPGLGNQWTSTGSFVYLGRC